jgi:hypothetical protein
LCSPEERLALPVAVAGTRHLGRSAMVL